MVARVAANLQAGDRVSLSLVGDDLLDARLETPGGFEHAMLTIPQPGRTLRLRVRYAF